MEIIQIAVASGERPAGLGKDNNVYLWYAEDGEWKLYKHDNDVPF